MRQPIHQFLVSRDFGGGGLVALEIAAHMNRQGHDSRVWIPGVGEAWREAGKRGLQPQLYELAGVLRSGLVRTTLANWRLSRRLRQSGGGVVHVNSPLAY